jgi:hypothetical protein
MTLIPRATIKFIDEQDRLHRRIARKERRVLFRTGSFGRTVMRRTIPRRKKKSLAGQPPHAHAPGGSGLKDVRFAVNLPAGTVVIGHPRYARASRGKTLVRSSKPVPQLLNEGGSARMETVDEGSRRSLPLNYRPRPFRDRAMRPTQDFMLNLMEKERL